MARVPSEGVVAPELIVDDWFNSDGVTLAELRGKVVALHAFQMLCPGCVSHGIPQAQRLHLVSEELVVLGLHSVFEHHRAMQPFALRAFLHEYRVQYPVAVDKRSGTARLPQTMQAFGMRGTPTLILIDREGRVAFHGFGRPSDLEVGLHVGALLRGAASPRDQPASLVEGCDEGGCLLS